MGKVQTLPTKSTKADSPAKTVSSNPPAYTRYGKRYMECWNFINKPGADGHQGKTISTKMGYGFENEKGNWHIELNALPTNMRLTLCNPLPRDEDRGTAS